MSRIPEVLAPAGTPEAFDAALAAGADAVYLGADGFNARRGAQNFPRESLPQLVRRCHIQGAKLYLTLNILMKESERQELLALAHAACDAGVDAVIVQDLGVARLLRQAAPSLRLHASTQMAVHNLPGVKILEELGFSRVVPARECSEEELREILAGTSMEVEVFVHGALCMCVSGQCYMSAMLGGRSGNRGLCAQPCRLPFRSETSSHALSLKDMSLIPHMDRLREMGVASLKIEGRMKRPEYAAAAVTACRAALRGEPPDMDILQSVFSRSGFTDGYFLAQRRRDMFGIREKEDVQAAQAVLGDLRRLYTDSRRRVRPVTFDAEFYMDETGSQLRIKDEDGNQVTVSGKAPEPALNKSTTEERVRMALEKTGETVYTLNQLQCGIAPGLLLYASALNDLRRRALAELDELRGKVRPIPFTPPETPASHGEARRPGHGRRALRVDAAEACQVTALMAREAELITLPLEELLRLPENHSLWDVRDKLCACIPRMIWKETPVRKALDRLRDLGIKQVSAGNLGGVELGRAYGFAVHGSSFLNVLNRDSVEALKDLGVRDVAVSFELENGAGPYLRGGIPVGLTAYGYLPLMTVRVCPGSVSVGCERCRKEENTITDRQGNRFSLRCRRGSCEIENPVPLYLADRVGELSWADFLVLRYTGESPEECERIFRAYQTGEKPPERFTRGLLYRTLQ